MPVRKQGLAIIVTCGVLLLSAVRAEAASIDVAPPSVPAGGTVTVSGDVLAPDGQPGCALPGTVLLFSAAFGDVNTPIQASAGADAKYSVQARIPGTIAPGSYPVSARCGGGNLGVQSTVIVTAPQLPATGSGGLLPDGTAPPMSVGAVLAAGLGLLVHWWPLRRRESI
jgi:hypothetical protein